jgi:hypothetical protein
MKGIFVNIDVLISDVLQMTNGYVNWSMIALMVARGVDRVQPKSANTIAKYVMVSFGIEI